MALVTDKPADTQSTNALDNIPADLLGPIPAELRLGANTLLVQEKPAQCGDVVTICARLRIVKEGKEQLHVDGDQTHFRNAKIIAAWIKGEPEPPNPEDEQPPLFGADGEVDDPQPGDDNE